jgi:hypothetical protein
MVTNLDIHNLTMNRKHHDFLSLNNVLHVLVSRFRKLIFNFSYSVSLVFISFDYFDAILNTYALHLFTFWFCIHLFAVLIIIWACALCAVPCVIVQCAVCCLCPGLL